MLKRILLFTLGILFFSCAWAELILKPGAPAKYVVRPGDTIWSIAHQYLQYPWQWSELYRANPDLSHNPGKLYPGDILLLKLRNGHAAVVREGRNTLKFSPTMREEALGTPIPTIPYNEIKPFLRGMRVVDEQTLNSAPYVLAVHDESLLGSTGAEIYVRHLDYPRYQDYYIYRKEHELVDPVSAQLFGYEAKFVGTARVLRYKPGSPAVLLLTTNKEEVVPGDRLSPIPPLTDTNEIVLREPNIPVVGQVIATLTEDSQIAQFQVAVINRGRLDSLKIGNVLAIYRKGQFVPDPAKPVSKRYHKHDLIQLPNERIGEVVIFKLFDHVALGLIMDSKQEIQNLDMVTNP